MSVREEGNKISLFINVSTRWR